MTNINNYLSVFGSYSFKSIDTTDSPYTVVDKDGIISIDTSAGIVTVNLPLISTSGLKTYTILDSTGDSNTNNITLNASGGDTINQSSTVTLVNAFNSMTIQNDEVNQWVIIGESLNLVQAPSIIGPNIYLEGTNGVATAVQIIASNTLGGIQITPGATGSGTDFTTGIFRFTSVSSSTGDAIIPVTSIIHEATSDGPGGGPGVQNMLTLADGQEGQKLHILYVVEGHTDDDILIVPTNPRGFTNLNLIEVGDTVEVLFQDSAWNVVGGFNTIVGAPTLSGPTVFIEGTSGVFNAVHITASNAAGGMILDSGTGGFDLDTTGSFALDADGQICLTSTQAAADAICIYATNTVGGIQLRAGTTGDIDFNRGALLLSSTLAVTSTGITAAIGLNDIIVEITTTTAADLLSIPDGTDGQILHLLYKAEGAPGDRVTITPDSPFDFTDIIFADLGDTMILHYRTEGWYIIGGNVIGAFGGVTGPGASTDDAIVRWDGVTGTFVQNSVAILSDSGALSGLIALDTSGGTGQMLLQTTQAAITAIKLNATAGGIDMDAAALFDVDIAGGQVSLTSKDNLASAISLITNTGTIETMVFTNTQGTATNAIDINALAGGIDVNASTVVNITAGTNMTLQAGIAGDIDLAQGSILLSSTLSLTGVDPGPVAIGLDDMVVEITTIAVTIGDVNLFTLANGTDGQMLKIVYIAESAGVETALITPVSSPGYTDITLSALGDTTELLYRSTGGWYITGGNVLAAGGGVTGPGASTDNALVRWNGATGTLIKNSMAILDDSGHLSGLTELDIIHTATESDDHTVELDVFVGTFGDVKAISVAYNAGTIIAGIDEEVIFLNIDESATTGGRIVGLEIVATAEGVAEIDGIECGINVNPILQESGVFGDADIILDIAANVTTELSNGGAGNIAVFTNDNETMTIGNAIKFSEMEFILDTVSSNPGIAPDFEYSTGVGTWATFSPGDGTNGMRNTGVVIWELTDIPGWLVGTGSNFLIRITRTRNSIGTTPIMDLVQISDTTIYSWNKDGDVSIRNIILNGITSGAVTIGTAAVAGTWTFTVPTDNGNAGEFLQTNGSGVSNWEVPLYPPKHLEGLIVADATAATKTISAGSCLSEDGTFNIISAGVLTPNVSTSGPTANGRDTADAELANNWYYIYVIADSTEVNPVASLLSSSSTSPTFPAGYNKKRIIGAVRNDGSSDFYDYYTQSTGKDRLYLWKESAATLQVLANGTATTWTNVDLSEFVPTISTQLYMQATHEGSSDVTPDFVSFRTDGSSVDGVYRVYAGATWGSGIFHIETSSVGIIEYQNNGSGDDTNVYAVGFTLSL